MADDVKQMLDNKLADLSAVYANWTELWIVKDTDSTLTLCPWIKSDSGTPSAPAFLILEDFTINNVTSVSEEVSELLQV